MLMEKDVAFLLTINSLKELEENRSSTFYNFVIDKGDPVY